MNLVNFRLRNFRRLKEVLVNLDPEISIFVGANNSGKTSATHGLKKFVGGSRADFSFHDFSAACWAQFDVLGDFSGQGDQPLCPTISIDLWFKVESVDLHRVIDLLPSLDWESNLVGIRIELAPVDLAMTLSEYRKAKDDAAVSAGEAGPSLWPKNLSDYLKERIAKEFDLVYYVLDRSCFNEDFIELESYRPPKIASRADGKGATLMERLLRVDLMDAQRHLSENSGGRSEDLSRCLGRFYKRNLVKLGTDYGAMGALAGSQEQLNAHLEKVFKDTLERLKILNYPGLGNPKIKIETTLNPSLILSSNDGARVFYALDEVEGAETTLRLPDQYNGLGFKNLIYMVVELLDLHQQWRQMEKNRPPLHVVIIEEPEAHMHAQLQQVFIREIMKLLPGGDDSEYYRSQFLVTTHSAHVLYERGFKPIRYFRREGYKTEVLNLSLFYQNAPEKQRDFLERYLKITHCDLFFADAAVLVEGNVERLLMPLFIELAAPRLRGSFLTVLEVGGAYAYRFKSLIEFLGITCLVITDIDSVDPVAEDSEASEDEDGELEGEGNGVQGAEEAEIAKIKGKACRVDQDGAVTCNQTLIQWKPQKNLVSEILASTPDERIQLATAESRSVIKISFQTRRESKWKDETAQFVGRTLEEAFALENLEWCQDIKRDSLGLRVRGAGVASLDAMSEKVFRKVKSSSFNKTNFALGLMYQKSADWKVPHYIEEGLQWLEGIVLPNEEDIAAAPESGTEAANFGSDLVDAVQEVSP